MPETTYDEVMGHMVEDTPLWKVFVQAAVVVALTVMAIIILNFVA